MKRWIIGKDGRYCRNERCTRYGKPGKPTLDSTTGLITIVCSKCDVVSAYQSTYWKEKRACLGCNHVRDVTVTRWHSGEEHARDRCDACELMNSVRVHRQTADRLEAKARAIYARRKSK